MYSYTTFESIFDNKTDKHEAIGTWEGFEQKLYALSQQEGYKPKRGEKKKGSPLISPAKYDVGKTRCNDNVICWGRWAAIDVDEYSGTPDNAIQIFNDYYYVCYSSASSTKEHPKFRIVLPLTTEVDNNDIRHFWFAVNTEFQSVGDKQCKDLSRMYYVPAQYPDAYNFIFTNKNKPFLDPKTIMNKHDFVDSFKSSFNGFPEAINKELAKWKKNKLNNYDYSWTSYHDCPFVNKKLVSEYKVINSTGWYSKMYSIATSIACNAIKKGYPITPKEVESLLRQIDNDTGGWYKKRPLELEAARAIDYSLKNI